MNFIKIFFFTILMVMLFIAKVYGQNPSDTLQVSKKLREEGKLSEALSLLNKYTRTHPKDMNALWLYGNTAYSAGNSGLALESYNRLIVLFPDHLEIKLDFAKILTSMGRLDQAGKLLKEVLSRQPSNTEAGIYLATVYYWEYKFNKAMTVLSDILAYDKQNLVANQLLKKIKEEKSPVIEMGADIIQDDQPMQTLTPRIQSGFYTPAFHQFRINAGIPTFNADTFHCYSGQLSVSNQFLFTKSGLGLFLETGLFHHPDATVDIFTGNIRLEKTFFGKLSLSAGFERKPYYLTLSSAFHPLPEHHATFSVSYGKDLKWKIKAGMDQASYPTDHNSILTLYSWIISPVVKFHQFSFRAGYGFNYSNAENNRFESKYTIARMIADSVNYVDGIYKPYFTPKNLQIHSAFIMAGIKAVKNLEINIKYTYGIYATTSNPYLYLRSYNDSLEVIRDYSDLNFNPYELNMGITYKINRSLSVTGDFRIFKTLYYYSQFYGLSLRKVL